MIFYPISGSNSNPTNSTSEIGVNSDNVISGGNWTANTYRGSGEQNDYPYVGVNLQTDEAGTLTFEFSQDGVNWSSYPTQQFTIASGINEVHGAWKGTRYVRPVFTGTGGRTFFRLRTMYSDSPVQLTAPLNQQISTDQDATVVRAVIHGENKDSLGNYVQGRMTADGAIRTSIVSALIDFPHDSYIVVDSSTTTDRYDYYSGGLAGTKVAEILITYKTTGKNDIISAEKTVL